MIPISKETKIKLLKSIKAGQFDIDEFPELGQELHKIEIEIIDRKDQVRNDDNTWRARNEDSDQ